MVTFDATVNLGQLITLGGMLGGGVLAIMAMRGDVMALKSDVSRLNDRLDSVDVEMRKQTDILIQLGRQDERLGMLQRQVDDIALASRALAAENAIMRHG